MAEEIKEEKGKTKFNFEKWHDKYNKELLILPLGFLIFGIIFMGFFYHTHHDIIQKDISLTGGTSITIYEKIDRLKLEQDLSGKLEDIHTSQIYDLMTGQQKAIMIETKSDGVTSKKVLEDYLSYKLTEKNSSFEFTGSSLSGSFYRQLLIAILVAFILMAVVIFIIFRTFVPSSAVVLSAFADIFMTLVTVNLLGIRVSSAGIIAFLMLIGYSVDTDILLTMRVLKRQEGTVNQRIWKSFKTGITMTLTAIVAVGVAWIIVKSLSPTLNQIFTILLIGLFFDIFNTWITNVSIIKWYMHHHNKG